MTKAQEELQRKLCLNRGRVLLVDPLRPKAVQEMAHRRVLFDMLPTEVTESTIASNTRSKNPLAAATLPATWAVYKLADAKVAYATRRPPFVQRIGQLKTGEARRQVALADKQGRLQETPRTAEFTAHAWDKDEFFWTLDLEGTRWIVKAYGGGPQGGVTYRKWLGVREGFSEKPVAFSMKQVENVRQNLTTRAAGSTEPHNEKQSDTIRVRSFMDIPAEEYPDLEVDDIMAAILSDKASKIESAAGTFNDEAVPVTEVIDLTGGPTSVPKKQLGSSRDFWGERRFELDRTKRGKKRQSDDSGYDSSSAEGTSETGPKRLCVAESHQSPEQPQERRDDGVFVRFHPFQPDLNSIATRDMVKSMERASLDPVAAYKDIAMDSNELRIQTPGINCTKHMTAASTPTASKTYVPLKTDREMSHLYSVTPPPQNSANISAPVVPAKEHVNGAVASTVQDDISPSTVLGNSLCSLRYFVPETIGNKSSYQNSHNIAVAATPRPAVPQAANVAALGESRWINIGDNVRGQSAEAQQPALNTSHPTVLQLGARTPGVTLSAHKQANTTLHVSLDTASSFVPIKLRSCMTISSFFDMVLSACDLEDQGHTISGVEVQYEWIPNMRMMIKRKIPDSFAEMLEIVDEAPCWKENGIGRCWVKIRVVLR
ncbi:hypothetical protein MMC18_008117 [Xylographa bjoerkii]|nr:hypothetical protein [Xylographa bjoerkii]